MSELLGVPIDARLVIVLVAVMIAGLLRGFVGFGAALISIPVFSLVLGPHAAIAVNNVMGLPAVFQLLPFLPADGGSGGTSARANWLRQG